MRPIIQDYVESHRHDGKLMSDDIYVGVTTMKIYCLPSCKGRPNPENLVLFTSRREAEQHGYRPCKSCNSALPVGSWKDNKTSIMLYPPREYSFYANLKYLTRSLNECLYHVQDNKIIRLLRLDGQDVLIEISSSDDQTICIRFVEDNKFKKSTRVAAAAYVWDWFDLDRDLKPFYELAQQDPLLQAVVKEYSGLRIMGISDLFEALCWAIMGQQINLSFAYTLKKRFVEKFGRYVEWGGRKYWLFPRPQHVSAISVDDLRELQFTTKKAEYIIGVARLIQNGKLTKQRLLQLGDIKAIEKELVSIRGIGMWTANYVTMRCLRNPAAFPLDDVGLHNAIKQVRNMERKPTKEEVLKFAEGWGEWKAYATFYLWMTLYNEIS